MGDCNWSTSGRSPRGRATASLSPLLANNGGAPWERLLAEESDKHMTKRVMMMSVMSMISMIDDGIKKKHLVNRSCQGRLSSYKLAAAVGQLRRERMV